MRTQRPHPGPGQSPARSRYLPGRAMAVVLSCGTVAALSWATAAGSAAATAPVSAADRAPGSPAAAVPAAARGTAARAAAGGAARAAPAKAAAGPAAGLARAWSAPAWSAEVQLAAARTAVAPGPADWSVTVSTLRDSGRGSLRAAIREADAAPPGLATVIRFTVTGTITLSAALPAVTRQVTIDGTSAPGYQAGRAPLVAGNAHGHPGLDFAVGSGRAKLLGLAVDRASGAGVILHAGSITLNGDYIGLDLAGRAAGNAGAGVYVAANSPGDYIGFNRAGRPGLAANVISGNRGNGIVLSGSSGSTLVANRIGTNPAGTRAIGNGGSGVVLDRRALGNEIGGTAFTDPATGQANDPTGDEGRVAPVLVVPPLGNLISGNAGNGILIESGSARNHLSGNFVGTTASGDRALGNGGNGVLVTGSASGNVIGAARGPAPVNLVSGNHEAGVTLRAGTRRNQVLRNYIGLNKLGQVLRNTGRAVANAGRGNIVRGNRT